MRRRKPPGGVREALAAEYRRLSAYDPTGVYGIAAFADRIEAGEPVVVNAFEVGLLPPAGRVRVEPDGTVVVETNEELLA